MLRKQSVLLVLIAAAALAMGSLVYLLDRLPEHTYFLFRAPALLWTPHAVFGSAGNQLPAFLHVYAFILLTVAVAGSSRASLVGICAGWLVIASLFEFGQHQMVAPLIAGALPAWLAHLPVLDNVAAYFLRGTFDPLDLLAMILGALAAGLTAGLMRNGVNTRAPDEPRRGVRRRLAIGGVAFAGMLGIIGSGGGDGGGFSFGAVDDSLIYVGGNASDALLVYTNANSVTGNTVAARTVAGVNTMLGEPRRIAVDMARNRIYVANAAGNSILVFSNARTMTGDIIPFHTISNTMTPISPTGVFIDPINNRLFITSDNSVLVYDNASDLNGNNIAPVRQLSGGSTALGAPTGIFADATRNLLYVANGDNRILVFTDASTANGGTGPIRTIPIPAASAGIFVDVMADRLYVTSGNSILVFDAASTADSSSVPNRTISGGATTLNQPRDVFVDTGADRLYVANAADDKVLVFNGAGTADGSTAPDRILNLPAFTDPWGIYVDVTPIVIGSTANRDGYVLNNGSSVNTDPVDNKPKTGDIEDALGAWRYVARQFYSFELTGIPSSVDVRSAGLRLYQANVVGSPYGIGNLGSVIVDHVNYGATLDSADYNAAALTANIGTLSTDASPGYKTQNVTANVASDVLAARSRSQFRLRFSNENVINVQDDYVQFTDAEDSCCAVNRPPQLVITLLP